MKKNKKPLFVGHINVPDTPFSSAVDPVLSVRINEDRECLSGFPDVINVLLCSNFPYGTESNVFVISDYELVSLRGNFYSASSITGLLSWDIDGIVSRLKKMVPIPAILHFFTINRLRSVKDNQWLSYD